MLTFWDRRQGSVSKFSTWPRGARAHVSAGCHQPALCRSRCGTFVSSSVHRGSDGTALLHATVISHVKSLCTELGGCGQVAAIIWPLCAEFMGRGFSLLITGPWEGVTQQRVPAGDLRPAGRGPYGGSRVPEGKKGQCRAHSVIPGTPPGPLGWASASLSAVRTLWGARGSLLLNAGGVSPGGGEGRAWLRISASGLSLSASFPFLLCAGICPRCGGYCQGESDREQPLPTVRSWGAVAVSGGHPPAWGLLGGGLRNGLRGGEGSVADPESSPCRTFRAQGLGHAAGPKAVGATGGF